MEATIIVIDRRASWIKYAVTVIIFAAVCFASTVFAATKTVNLSVNYKTVNFASKKMQAIAVNNQIPAPTLHFKQGDKVIINVHNQLDKGTAIHWHGLLVPWRMDGVATVTQKPIPPGKTFSYRFKLRQSGTYWYHAHAGLQEQRGLYGGFIIDPPHQRFHYNKDFVIVLSDWSNTLPDRIFANLKKNGEYYSSFFPHQASLVDFLRDYSAGTPMQKKMLTHSYLMMQKMRMGIYDISDIAYDKFLLNGRTKTNPWIRKVKVGDIVRLRFIDAGASTLFNIKIPGTILKVIHVQGNDIVPYYAKSISLAPGETYDVLVKITKKRPYLIYAESTDQVGAAFGVLLPKTKQKISFANIFCKIKPFPKPKPVHMMMPPKSAKESKTKYRNLKAAVKTNNPNKPVHVIKIMLSGFMHRYMWFINGKSEWEAKPILIQHGQRYRIVFTNHTMMHHPMHLHGHWLILRNGHGAYDPLLHTIDVPPNATVIADFDAIESGQWYFHCHNLYHMKAGMATIFRYKNATNIPNYLSGHKQNWYASSKIHLAKDITHNLYKGSLNTLIGYDRNKIQFYSREVELKNNKLEQADLDIFYWHLLDQFWAIKGGANYVYKPATTPYLQPGIGIEGLLPFFIETNLRSYFHRGSFKFDLAFERETHIYRRLFLNAGIRGIFATKTVTKDEVGNGLNLTEWFIGPEFILTPRISVFAEYEQNLFYGSRKRIRLSKGESGRENEFLIGFSLLV
jgi:FtsP/CotA-like multicopper oxidase with cupredoxin domain